MWRGSTERSGVHPVRGVGSPLPFKMKQIDTPMDHKWHTAGALAASLLLLASCSVKEDRDECPCWLEVAVSGCERIARNITVSAWNPTTVFMEGIDVRDYPKGYERTVPKGYVTVSAFAGRKVQELSGESLVIPDGLPCDSLWAHRALVNCNGEFARDTAVLHKQFATVHLKIDNLKEGEPYPYSLVLRSRYDGLRLTDCSPHAGAWSCSLDRLPDGTYVFRVPRQGDGSLTIDLVLDGQKMDEYPVGEYILRSGYSWLSEDLDDIWIGMDYGGSEPNIVIEKWGDSDPYDSEL